MKKLRNILKKYKKNLKKKYYRMVSAHLFVFFTSSIVCVTDRDLYNVLGVSRAASQAEIKSAYKKLARKYHPDTANGSNGQEGDTTELFQEIAYAKEILTDSEKRNIYDQYGHDGLAQMGKFIFFKKLPILKARLWLVEINKWMIHSWIRSYDLDEKNI